MYFSASSSSSSSSFSFLPFSFSSLPSCLSPLYPLSSSLSLFSLLICISFHVYLSSFLSLFIFISVSFHLCLFSSLSIFKSLSLSFTCLSLFSSSSLSSSLYTQKLFLINENILGTSPAKLALHMPLSLPTMSFATSSSAMFAGVYHLAQNDYSY